MKRHGAVCHELAAAGLMAVAGLFAAAPAAAAGWPPAGYTAWSANVAYRSVGGRCGDFATNGCWKLLVVARRGCRGGLFITVNEFRGRVLVGDAIDSVDVLPAGTPARMEFDPDVPERSVVARIATVECFSG